MSAIHQAWATVRSLSGGALDLLAPRGCAACDAEVRRGAPFCASCRATLRAAHVAHVDAVPVLAGAAYGDAVASAIQRFKYGGRTDLAPALAALAANALGSIGDAVLVPVPLHSVRLAERGYNQAALIAREIARSTGASLDGLALARRRATKQQARQGGEERQRNVAGAFAVRRPRKLAGRRIVLVDDVVTTGATASACIRALTACGAPVLAVAAVALAGHARTA